VVSNFVFENGVNKPILQTNTLEMLPRISDFVSLWNDVRNKKQL
jgi:hypothetical protein